MYQLHILGELELRMGSQILLRGCSRPLQLLCIAYLSHRPPTVEIAERILWPVSAGDTRRHSLRQAIYKLNKVAPQLLKISDGRILINHELLTTDAQVVEQHRQPGNVQEWAKLIRGPLISDPDRGGIEFAHWVESVRATHWAPLVRDLHSGIKLMIRKAEWENAVAVCESLPPALADDPRILALKAKALIYCGVAGQRRSDVTSLIKACARSNPALGKHLNKLWLRRLRWDRRAKIHVGPFIGRQREVREFSDLQRSSAAAGYLCVVSGPIGIGKSRTVRQFARIAAIRGNAVQTVRFNADRHAETNYAKVVRKLRALSNLTVREKDSAWSSAAELVGAHLRMIDKPALLVIDDLDFAGHSCLDMVYCIIRMIGKVKIGVVVTAKDSALVTSILRCVPPGVQARQLRLRRLEEQERSQLSNWIREHHRLDDHNALTLVEVARGNPGHAHRLAQQFHREGVLNATAPDQSVSELDRLPPLCSTVFALVSFAGKPVYLKALEGTLGLSPTSLRGVLTKLEDLGLVDVHQHQAECTDRFLGDSTQRTMELVDLRKLTVRLAQQTARRSPADAAQLAERAGAAGIAARYYYRAALRLKALSGWADAEAMLSRCLAVCADPRLRSRAEFLQAEMCFRLRRFDEAVATYADLLNTSGCLGNTQHIICQVRHAQITCMKNPDLAPAAFDVVSRVPTERLQRRSHDVMADVLQSLAAIAIVTGQPTQLNQAVRAIESALDRAAPNSRWLELASTACKIRLQTDGYASALSMSEKYVARARASGAGSDLASTLLSRAIILTAAGRLATADELYREVYRLVLTNNLPGYSHILVQNHAVALMEMGDSDEAIAKLKALRDLDESVGIGYYIAFDELNLATAYYESGNLHDAEYHAEQALRYRDAFPNQEAATAVALLGLIANLRGDGNAAAEALDKLGDYGQGFGDLSYGILLRANVFRSMHKGAVAVELLLRESVKVAGAYRPAALRLRVAAAEMLSEFEPGLARDLAHQCASDALVSGMQSLVSRAKDVCVGRES